MWHCLVTSNWPVFPMTMSSRSQQPKAARWFRSIAVSAISFNIRRPRRQASLWFAWEIRPYHAYVRLPRPLPACWRRNEFKGGSGFSMNPGFGFGREALADRPLHLAASGPVRAVPSRSVFIMAHTCRR